MRKSTLIIMAILAVVATVGTPLAHASNNVHTFYLGNSAVGSCTGKCENLLTSTGTADTGTGQNPAHNTGTFQIEPDNPATLTTGTPSTSSVSGYAWVYNTDLGSASIQSGTWTFDLTVAVNSLNGGPVGNIWITVWSCTSNSLGSCTFLFKNWDNATNVLASTTATKYTYTTGTIGPFSGVHFISVEYWLSVTTGGKQTCCITTETTVSSASDVVTPGWNYAQSIFSSLSLASSLTKGIGKTLSGALGFVSTLTEKNSFTKTLAASITFTIGNMVANVD